MPVFRIGACSGGWKNKLSFWLMMAYMIACIVHFFRWFFGH